LQTKTGRVSTEPSLPGGGPTCGVGWKSIDTPTPGNFSELKEIAAVSSTDIWAAGTYVDDANSNHIYLQHWDGDKWSIVREVDYPGQESIADLAAIGPDDVWAVGSKTDETTGLAEPLLEHWNGITWSNIPAPEGTLGRLQAVAASASNDIWAVGYRVSCEVPLFLHWDGSNWTQYMSTSSEECGYAVLTDVAVLSSTEAWAIGQRDDGGTILYSWDGTHWTEAQTLTIIGCPRFGCGITALTANDIWVAGFQDDRPFRNPTMAHWNGTTWAEFRMELVDVEGARGYSMFDVAANAPDDVWAIGTQLDLTHEGYGVLYHWNGAKWSIMEPAVDAISDTLRLNDLAVAGPGDIWTVGSTGAFSYHVRNNKAHVERYQPTFTDVHPDGVFYEHIQSLACKGVISGFPDGTFRSNDPVTRSQIAKIVSNAAGYNESHTGQTFADVPPSSPFYGYVERIASRHIAGGYECGGTGEPCDEQHRPYFRPGDDMSRGQIAKVVANAKGYNDSIPADRQTFNDVQPDHTFWLYIERAAQHGVVGGYACNTTDEPCPGTYFRPQNNVTRGQAAKIVSNTFFPASQDGVCSDVPQSVNMTVGPSTCAPAGTDFTFTGSGFQPGESVGFYVTAPDGSVIGAPFELTADESGNVGGVTFDTGPSFPTGVWVATMEGDTSNATAKGYFKLLAP
jgi:hypothetical protein